MLCRNGQSPTRKKSLEQEQSLHCHVMNSRLARPTARFLMENKEVLTNGIEDLSSKERVLQNEKDIKTWLSETLDGNMYHEDTYNYAFSELWSGDGRAMGPVFDDALEDAYLNLGNRKNLEFEVRRRVLEKEEYDLMIKMAEGELPNTMVVVSDFPPELWNSDSDVGGYNVSRKQTMLRVVTRDYDGRITVRTQSLDGSDRESLEQIYKTCGREASPGELLGQRIHMDIAAEDDRENLVEELRITYDRNLSIKYGRQMYGGRDYDVLAELGTSRFVEEQQDLISHIRYNYNELDFDDFRDQKILGSLAATISERYERTVVQATEGYQKQSSVYENVRPINVESEIALAVHKAVLQGKTFSGCGASVSLDANKTELENNLNSLGYGNKTDKESTYSFNKLAYCRVCQAPPKEAAPKKMCGPCNICRECDSKL